eukprot:COSAG03_NODE_3124_length_2197_cov_1420.287893_4_plen_30_part_01
MSVGKLLAARSTSRPWQVVTGDAFKLWSVI